MAIKFLSKKAMEESEKPKNITTCDTSKKDNSNVINHLDDDDPVTKKEVDNETKTVSADKASHENIKVVSKDEKNASNTDKAKTGSNSIEPQKSIEKNSQLKEEKNESKDSGDSKLLKENSVSEKNDIPMGDVNLLNNKKSGNYDDQIGIDHKRHLDKDKIESSFNMQSSKMSNNDSKEGQNVDEDEPTSSLKNAPPLPRRQSLDKKVRIEFNHIL